MSQVQAIVFVRPTQENFSLLIKELRAPAYKYGFPTFFHVTIVLIIQELSHILLVDDRPSKSEGIGRSRPPRGGADGAGSVRRL